MTQQRTVSARLTATIDTQSISAAVNANAKITSSYEDMKRAADAVGLTVAELAQRTGVTVEAQKSAAAAITTSSQQVVNANKATAQSYAQTANAATAAADAQVAAADKALQAAQSAALKQGAGRIAGLGSIVGGAAGGAVFRDAAQIVQLGVAFGAAGVVAGGLAVGLRVVTDNASKAADAIAASAKAYRDVAQEAAHATLAELNHQRGLAQTALALAKRAADEAQAAADLAEQNVVPLAALLGTDAAYKGLKQTAEDANKELEAAQNRLNALNLALAGVKFTAADVTNEITGFGELLGGKFKQIVGDAAKTLNTALENLNSANESANQSYLDALTNQGNAREELYKLQTEETEGTTKHREKLRQIILDQYAKEDDARAKSAEALGDKLADIQRKSDQKIMDRKAQDNLTIEELVAKGDQAGAQSVLAHQKLALQEEARTTQAAKDDATDASKKALDDQLAAARDYAVKAVDSENKRFREESETRQKAVARAKADLENAIAAEAVATANGHAQRVAYEVAHQQALYNTIVAGGANIRTVWNTTMSALANGIWARFNPDNVGRGGAGGGGNGGTPPEAGGFMSPFPLGALGTNRSQPPEAAGFSAPFPPGAYGSAQVQRDRARAISQAYAAYNAAHGSATSHAFDTGGIVTKPGWGWLGVVGERYIPPMAEKAALNGGSRNVNLSLKLDVHAEGSRGVSKQEAQDIAVAVGNQVFVQIGRIVREETS